MKLRSGTKAWIGLTVYVIAADAALIRNRKETMSTVFGDALVHPLRRWPVILTWGILTAHLFSNLIPLPESIKRYDPIGAAARLIAHETDSTDS